MSRYKDGDIVIVKSYRQCGEGNGISKPNSVCKLIGLDNPLVTFGAYSGTMYGDKYVTGLGYGDWIVEYDDGYVGYFLVSESHIIGKKGSLIGTFEIERHQMS
jgi:hypothetical protein